MGNNHLKGRVSSQGQGKNQIDFQATQTDSPLLPVEQIERLQALNPEWAQFVFDQTKAEAEHRRSETKRVNTLIFRERLFGTSCALLVAAGGLGISAYCASINQPIVASIIGGTTIVSLVGLFLYGKKVTK